MAIKKTVSAELPKDFEWEADEFIEYKKSAGWYVTFGIIALAAGGIFVWLKQYLSAAVVILAIIVLFSQSTLKPKKNKYKIDSRGIAINDKFYPYENLLKFWIVITAEGNNLYLKTNKKFHFPVTIHLGSMNPEPLERYLKQYLPEDIKAGELTTDRFSRLLKF